MKTVNKSILFFLLYVILPPLLGYGPVLAERYFGLRITFWVIPVLIFVAFIICLYYGLRHEMKIGDIFSFRNVNAQDWYRMIKRWAIFAVLLSLLLYFKAPECLMYLPRRNAVMWMIIMICYPLLSVFAQGIIYRWYYDKVFATLFPKNLRLVIGALAFSWAHIVFFNIYAIVFTFIGGLLFLSTYRKTRSVFFSDIEHALYGDFIFTIGWGTYFFAH